MSDTKILMQNLAAEDSAKFIEVDADSVGEFRKLGYREPHETEPSSVTGELDGSEPDEEC